MVNSRLGHFTATQESSICKRFHHPGHPFSLSYGVNLPSSLTRVRSHTLGYSPHLPVSVYGTVTRKTPYEAFLERMVLPVYGQSPPHHSSGLVSRWIYLPGPPTSLNPNPIRDWHFLLRPPFGQAFLWW